MSLDIYLILKTPITKKGTGVFVRENGQNRELTFEEVKEKWPNSDIEEQEYEYDYVYEANITHSLNNMAREAGIYEAVWGHDPEVTHAKHLIEPLLTGLNDMIRRPSHYEEFDSSNGWGTYKDFVPWLSRLLENCEMYPEAELSFSR